MSETLASTDAGHVPAASNEQASGASPAAETSKPAPEAKAPQSFRDLMIQTKGELEAEPPKRGPGRPRKEPAPVEQAADAGEAGGAVEATPKVEAAPPAKEEKQEPPLKPHSRWTAEEKEAFGKLPREGQQVMLTQYANWEKGFSKKFEETAGARKLKEDIEPLFTPEIRQQMQASGLTEGAVIMRLADFAKEVNDKPVEAVARIMQRHNIDPRIFLPKQESDGQETPSTVQQIAPIVQPLLNEIETLKKQTEALKLEQKNWFEQKAEEQGKSLSSIIASFSEEKGADGALKYPHFEHVADSMAKIIENDPRYADMDPRQRLEEAYMIAVLSDPSLRNDFVSAEVSKRAAALEAERANARLKAAATAKPAAAAAPETKSGPKNFRDIIAETKRELGM